ncbi:MAG: TetR/AcrR family transcriptional regulator [Pseudolysinimonas sp.]
MPTPDKTSRDAIVVASRELVERDGIDGLTMAAVAERVGVQPPSLYKRVRNRGELISLVVGASIDDLSARMEAQRQPNPRARLVALAGVLRSFAHERPVGYALVFGTHSSPPPEAGAVQRSIAPLLDAVAAITGPEHALDGARLLTAWATGYLTLELSDRLRMGGDIDAAWNWGLARIVAALQS